MSDSSDWPDEPEQAATLVRELAKVEPERLLAVVRSRAGRGDAREDWLWAFAAQVIARCHAELLLTFLSALRSIAANIKHHTLDDVGEHLAVASVERPTLAECRAAIGEADETPRWRSVFSKSSATWDVGVVLGDFVLDALGGAEESVSRTPETADGPALDRRIQGCAEELRRVHTSTVESASCSVRVERTETFVPGDINYPPQESESVRVVGTRRGGPTLTMRVYVGECDIRFHVDGAADDRDRILDKIWRAFGRLPTA